MVRSAGGLWVTGFVTDDARAPIRAARVGVSLARLEHDARASKGDLATDVSLGLARPDRCGGAPRPVLDVAQHVVLTTDETGLFCVQFSLPEGRYAGHLDVHPPDGLDAAQTDVALDSSLRSALLAFDPVPTIAHLEDATIPVDVVATASDGRASAPGAGWALRLEDEGGRVLATATSNGAGRARFVVPSERMGPAGPGELRVTFAGDASSNAASQGAFIQRRTNVRLLLPEARTGYLPAGSPDDGLDVRVNAQASCAPAGCATVPTGVIVLHRATLLVGAAPLVGGQARVRVTFAAPPGDVALRVDYVPDAPWLEAGPSFEVIQPVQAHRPWRKFVTAAAGLMVAAWFWRTRFLRASPVGVRPLSGEKAEARPRFAPRAMDRHRGKGSGWTGRIVDAHDRTPVRSAGVRIERPAFDSVAVVAQTASNDHGEFALETETRAGDTLVVQHALYVTLRRALPQPGAMDIAVVQRRRALLERLVGWARGRAGGSSADDRARGPAEPTPAQVRAAAGHGSPVGQWADAVERTVYGAAPVDADAQSAIDRLAPDVGQGDGAVPLPKAPPARR